MRQSLDELSLDHRQLKSQILSTDQVQGSSLLLNITRVDGLEYYLHKMIYRMTFGVIIVFFVGNHFWTALEETLLMFILNIA